MWYYSWNVFDSQNHDIVNIINKDEKLCLQYL